MQCWRSASARMKRSVRPLNSIALKPSSMPNRSRKAWLIARPPAPPLQSRVLSTSNRIRRATSALLLPHHADGPLPGVHQERRADLGFHDLLPRQVQRAGQPLDQRLLEVRRHPFDDRDAAQAARLPHLLDHGFDRLIHAPAHAVEQDDGAAAEADDRPDAQYGAEQVLHGADSAALEQVLGGLKGGEEAEAGAQLLHQAFRLGEAVTAIARVRRLHDQEPLRHRPRLRVRDFDLSLRVLLAHELRPLEGGLVRLAEAGRYRDRQDARLAGGYAAAERLREAAGRGRGRRRVALTLPVAVQHPGELLQLEDAVLDAALDAEVDGEGYLLDIEPLDDGLRDVVPGIGDDSERLLHATTVLSAACTAGQATTSRPDSRPSSRPRCRLQG